MPGGMGVNRSAVSYRAVFGKSTPQKRYTENPETGENKQDSAAVPDTRKKPFDTKKDSEKAA